MPARHLHLVGTMDEKVEVETRVLVVDDDPVSREGLQALLEDEGFVVAVAGDGRDALAKVETFRPDLVLSDVCMPNTDGFELARALRTSTRAEDTALILISGNHDIDRRVHALDIGADDFMGKPLDLDELLARIRAHVRRTRRHSDVLRLSIVDELTSTLNRRGLFATLERELQKAVEAGTPLSVLVVDVDDFKKVNDTYGHAAGDEVLKRTANLLRHCVREHDTVARFGGDELAVVLPRSDAWDASAVAARVRFVEGPADSQVTLSVGTATLRPGETVDDLLGRADANMYDEKASSKVRSRSRPPAVDTTYIKVNGRSKG